MSGTVRPVRQVSDRSPPHAPVLELAYRDDSKSSALVACGFESHRGYGHTAPRRHGWPCHLGTTIVRTSYAAIAWGSGVPARQVPGTTLTIDHTTGSTTATTRQTDKVRERLTRIQDELRRVRATERVLADQVAHLDDVAADAETRKIVAQTPLADREWRDARTDLDRHRALLEDARREIDDRLRERDRLLDRLFELDTAPRRRDAT